MNDTLRQALLDYMGKAGYLPQNKSEISRGLGVLPQQRAELRQLIDQLESERTLVRLKKGTYALKRASADSIDGRIKVLRSGKILFIADESSAMPADPESGLPMVELVVPPHRLGSAMDGDRVQARLEFSAPKGWRRHHKGRPVLKEMQIGIRIEKVLERGRRQWVGVFRPGRGFGKVLGDGVSSPETIEIIQRPAGQEPKPGQLVVVEPVSWGEGKVLPKGRIAEVLGWSDDSGVDIEVIIRKYQLPVEFSTEALEEVAGLPDDLNEEVLARREDWSGQAVMSIDPEGAKDFDDAIHVRKLDKGWELAVHIADVSHYVKPGSALDRDARARGNSTYLPDRVLPMLPSRLSDDLCSLRAGEVRLTKAAIMRFNEKGERVHARFTDAFIRNERQMSYAEAYKLMMGTGADAETAMLKEAWKLASLLRGKRMEAGALDLDFPDIRVFLDDEGHPVKVVAEEYDESHQLIEEFMLAANEAVAETLKNEHRPAIYRVHENPDEAKLKEFGEQCKLYGHRVGDLTQRKHLVSLLASLKGSPDEQMLKLALLRSMMRARYDTAPLGHYGLAKSNYCHFTSPIRRYADLEVHRSLDSLLYKSKFRIGAVELKEVADHISDTERMSSDAERDAHRLKLFEWLDDQTRSDNPEIHDGLVNEVKNYGVFVDIPRLQIKGLIKAAVLAAEGWRHEGFAERWTNRFGDRIAAGGKLKVVPAEVDREKQWVDFRLEGGPGKRPKTKRSRRSA